MKVSFEKENKSSSFEKRRNTMEKVPCEVKGIVKEILGDGISTILLTLDGEVEVDVNIDWKAPELPRVKRGDFLEAENMGFYIRNGKIIPHVADSVEINGVYYREGKKPCFRIMTYKENGTERLAE